MADNYNSSTISLELPILPLKETVVYPDMMAPLVVGQARSVKLVDEAIMKDKTIGVVAIKNTGADLPGPGDLYAVGTIVHLARMMRMPDGTINLIVQGTSRMKIEEYTSREPYLKAKVRPMPDKLERDAEADALVLNIRAMVESVAKLVNIPQEMQAMFMSIDDPGRMADLLAYNMDISAEDKQRILEMTDIKERLREVNRLLSKELQVLELRKKIESETTSEMNKIQREHILREQMKAIQKELGEGDETTIEIDELRKRIAESKMPEEARKEAERELDRLSRMPPQAAEYTVSRTYLEWLTEMPWAVSTEDNLDIGGAENILNDDHYGLDKVKRRILEYLAVRKLKADMKGPILCFVGPPGVGKTSLGKSIARALGRKFVRISLGGVRDEAEIRGHRRTYIGALPGRIIQGIKRAGSNNPVFMLDEIDKVGTDFRGDPSSALLEVLDPEQNNSFSDHYLDVPFDLSKVMFITTANVLDTIPPALRDRMEVLGFPGYTEEEKLRIAVEHLIPKQLSEHGLTADDLGFDEGATRAIIRDYTREAGVRNLEREIGAVCRGVAREVAKGNKERRVIKADMIHQFLGPARFFSEVAERTSEPGVATGLSVTPVGGEILFVESTFMKGGKGGLILTGQLGDVMKESAQAALSFIRSRADKLGINPETFSKNDIHIHVPAGAIPKDGPSAGITMATSLASLLTARSIRSDVAMTGEITLRGKVLPVGGIKEKVLAAHRAGIKAVILPKRNEKDIEDVPESVMKSMEFRFVENVGEVFDLALQEAKVKGTDKTSVAEVKRPRRAVRKAAKTPPRQPAMFS
jgi:ATP-dependent Lon protease